jgi:murein DD-endopeptidase MepM/ murein hydrolase activator NlpD
MLRTKMKHFAFLAPLFFVIAMSLNSCYWSDPLKRDRQEITQDSVNVKSDYLYGFNLDSFAITYDTIKKNQNLGEIFNKYNVADSLGLELVKSSKGIFNVRSIRPRLPFQIVHKKSDLKTPFCMIYHPSKLEYVQFNFQDTNKMVFMVQNKVDTVRKTLTGVINSSLYQTIVENHGSPTLAGMLYDVYAWQIDFFAIQKGDHFNVLYDQLEIDGNVISIQKIYAAEFTHNNELFDAYWFETEEKEGYYNSKGESMKRNFLKAPLEFKRISSKFSYRRLHPVHKVYKAHLGVDYAAPMGTPVVALGDGRITKIGYSGGAGHMIKIKHPNNYETAYLHLRNYAKGMKNGKMVKQGELIGYVGSTGWSTGPHLDFRVWKNGKNIDPLKLKPEKNHSLSEADKVDFKKTQETWAVLLKAKK